ncbi:RNA polymerase sigma factor [Paenibacillus tritici]|uniref:RNA polymerase sigma factor n=1 Tax=Paenibacillus tritici TaxID=1873425 RepID=UPI001FE2A230|nr:sigma factor [Paenibacillus tritici]
MFALSLSRNRQVSEEITQETFVKAVKNINQFKGNCKLSVLLCQIAKNTYFTYMGNKSTTNRAIPRKKHKRTVSRLNKS